MLVKAPSLHLVTWGHMPMPVTNARQNGRARGQARTANSPLAKLRMLTVDNRLKRARRLIHASSRSQ